MSRIKQAGRIAISLLPKSKILSDLCRCYCQHSIHGLSPFGSSCNMNSNGELRLIHELAQGFETVFDVGANVGDWTQLLHALNPKITIHSFEPTSGAFSKLAACNFPNNVHLHHIGLSSAPGSAQVHLFGDASGMNSLHNRNGLEDSNGLSPATTTEQVQLTTLDRFCEENSVRSIDFLKIDTEGHEVDVLLGGRESFASGIIRYAQFEYGGTYIDSRRLLKDVFEFFSTLEYRIFLIIPNGLFACPRYDQRLENFLYNNFVAIRRDLISVTPSAAKSVAL